MHLAVYAIKNAVSKGTAQLCNALLQRRLREPGLHSTALHITAKAREMTHLQTTSNELHDTANMQPSMRTNLDP